MRAEIGFAIGNDGSPLDLLQLVVTAESSTELTALKMFAQRTGRKVAPSASSLTIDEDRPKEPPIP